MKGENIELKNNYCILNLSELIAKLKKGFKGNKL